MRFNTFKYFEDCMNSDDVEREIFRLETTIVAMGFSSS